MPTLELRWCPACASTGVPVPVLGGWVIRHAGDPRGEPGLPPGVIRFCPTNAQEEKTDR